MTEGGGGARTVISMRHLANEHRNVVTPVYDGGGGARTVISMRHLANEHRNVVTPVYDGGGGGTHGY